MPAPQAPPAPEVGLMDAPDQVAPSAIQPGLEHPSDPKLGSHDPKLFLLLSTFPGSNPPPPTSPFGEDFWSPNFSFPVASVCFIPRVCFLEQLQAGMGETRKKFLLGFSLAALTPGMMVTEGPNGTHSLLPWSPKDYTGTQRGKRGFSLLTWREAPHGKSRIQDGFQQLLLLPYAGKQGMGGWRVLWSAGSTHGLRVRRWKCWCHPTQGSHCSSEVAPRRCWEGFKDPGMAWKGP